MIADVYLRVELWHVVGAALALLLVGYAAGEARRRWRGPAETVNRLEVALGTIFWQAERYQQLEAENADLRSRLSEAAGGAQLVTAAVVRRAAGQEATS